MAQTPPPQTNPEVDRLVARMSKWIGETTPESTKRLTLSREDAQWLLAEIEGGREAFGTIVQANAGLRARVATMQHTIDILNSMRK